jgi:hypothetical protein
MHLLADECYNNLSTSKLAEKLENMGECVEIYISVVFRILSRAASPDHFLDNRAIKPYRLGYSQS